MPDVTFESLLARTIEQLVRGTVTYLPVASLILLPAGAVGMMVAVSQERAAVPTAGGCLATLGLGVLNLVLTQVVTAGISYGVFRGLRGERASFGACLRLAVSRWISLLGAATMVSLAVIGGTMLLIVPGMIAMVALAVTVPALVVERLSAAAALGRSWELTDGYRWPIFGVLFLVLLATIAISLGVGVVQLFVGAAAASVLQYLWGVVSTAFAGVFSAVTYHALRVAREGLDEDELAAVFD